MKKLREISEEQFLVLAALGADACWDTFPFEKSHHYLLEYYMGNVLWGSAQEMLKYKGKDKRLKFYALVEVEDSNEEAQEDYT